MTTQKAINVLRNTAWLGTEKDREKVEKAIETLSNTSEIPNSSDDLISRQAAIDNLKKHLNETDVPDHYPGIFNAIEEWLDDWEVPSAQPERERIKWIPHKSVFGGLDERVYTCDKCGYNIGFHVENFCPNCGGKYER